MVAMYRKMTSIVLICMFCAIFAVANAQKESAAQTTPAAPGTQQPPDVSQSATPAPWEIDEGLLERLERGTNDPHDFESVAAFHRLLKKHMYLTEKKAPRNEITDVDVEILKTILAVNPKRRDIVFNALERTWDRKEDYFLVFINIFTGLQRYRDYFRLEYGQLKAWEVYLKAHHRKILDERERKEAARVKAASRSEKKEATPTPTPTPTPAETKAEK